MAESPRSVAFSMSGSVLEGALQLYFDGLLGAQSIVIRPAEFSLAGRAVEIQAIQPGLWITDSQFYKTDWVSSAMWPHLGQERWLVHQPSRGQIPPELPDGLELIHIAKLVDRLRERFKVPSSSGAKWVRVPWSVLIKVQTLPAAVYYPESDHMPAYEAQTKFTMKEYQIEIDQKRTDALVAKGDEILLFIEQFIRNNLLVQDKVLEEKMEEGLDGHPKESVEEKRRKLAALQAQHADIQSRIRLIDKARSGPTKAERDEAKEKLLESAQVELIKGLEGIHENGEKLGIDPVIREETKRAVLSTLESIRESPGLSALLVRLKHEQTKYIASHSLLLSYISCAVASQMDWSSETTSFKLVLASFMHDIVLKNHELAKIRTLHELSARKSEFSPEEIRVFEQHPQLGFDLVQKFEEMPPDVDLLILQHHERPDGSGFPRQLSHARIAPLSALFIVSHDLTQFLIDKKEDIKAETIREFLRTQSSLPQVGPFKKALAAVQKISDGDLV
jgi:HD-GYP domain-containing protein (c-di-GMP phosphodiesterase class II)